MSGPGADGWRRGGVSRRCGALQRRGCRAVRAPAALLLLALAACSAPEGDSGPAIETDPGPVEVGAGLGVSEGDENAGAADRRQPSGVVLLTIVGRDGPPAPGIPVAYTGPVDGRAVSDAEGAIRLELPAGDYNLRVVEGCTETVEVFDGGSGHLGVPAGVTFPLELGADWRHRYAPWPSVSTPTNPWPTGEPQEILYAVQDRCEDDLAPGASYPTWEAVGEGAVEVVGTPSMRADASGYGRLEVVCRTAGDGSIWLRDRANPSDALEILAVQPPPDPSRPWCGS